MNDPLESLASCSSRAIRWLSDSEIRTPSGAYRSIYSQRLRRHTCWYGNETCMLSTAGAVMALEAVGRVDLARESAEHICDLALADGPLRGAIRSGADSRYVFANWMFSGVLALLAAYERTGHERFLIVARHAGHFIIDRMQNRDGSFLQSTWVGRGATVQRYLQPRHTWLANSVEALLGLRAATEDERFAMAADRFVEWLEKQQRADGAFPFSEPTALSRIASAVHHRNLRATVAGSRERHPAAQSHAIRALMLSGRVEQAKRATHWLGRQLGPNGLFYQWYFDRARHTLEEDVMPTAHFGLNLLAFPELDSTPDILKRIALGIGYAQIDSQDPNARGGIRGLPLHPESGQDAYCWDTAHGVLFLHRFLRRCALG